MRCRLPVLLLFLLTLALAATASASPLATNPTPQPPVLEHRRLVPDPYVDLQDFTSKARQVVFCPCQIGVNCCIPDNEGAPCGAPVQSCHCDILAKCRYD